MGLYEVMIDGHELRDGIAAVTARLMFVGIGLVV